ncbi:unnamed protein product [Microthlaspi erraticum]|uniref:Uncharacterized protein n=1 Tax=Microthlaspi erraticum TaxID=1685480 RepID=A0A6D2IL21_9BRAS|nr:unnamed protein product [Microthlaspi erraticum]
MSLMENEIEKISDTPECPELTTLLFQKIRWNISGEFFKSMPKDIISKEKAENIFTEEEAGTIIPFQRLEHFQVKDLPKLKSIYWSPLPFPRLSNPGEDLVIHNENKLDSKVEWEDEATKERFLPSLQQSWIDEFEWEGEAT